MEPPFIICVTICFALFVAAKGLNFRELLPHYLATATYSHNIVYRSFSPINPVTWSLEVEIQFYLIAPLIARIFSVNRRARRALLITLIAGASLLQPALRAIDTINVLQFMQFFLTGFLLADIYVSDWKRAPTTGYLMDASGLAALAAVYWATGNHDYGSDRPAWIAVSCLGLFVGCCAAFRGRITSRILSNPWIVVTGGMCYTDLFVPLPDLFPIRPRDNGDPDNAHSVDQFPHRRRCDGARDAGRVRRPFCAV